MLLFTTPVSAWTVEECVQRVQLWEQIFEDRRNGLSKREVETDMARAFVLVFPSLTEKLNKLLAKKYVDVGFSIPISEERKFLLKTMSECLESD